VEKQRRADLLALISTALGEPDFFKALTLGQALALDQAIKLTLEK